MKLFLALLPIFFLCGCTTPPTASPPAQLPPGYYALDAGDWFYRGLCEVTWEGRDYRVQCLEQRRHTLRLKLHGNGSVTLMRSPVNLGKIRRTLSGEGDVLRPGHLAGKGRVWTKSIAGFSRDHRKGPWSMRPATPAQIEKARGLQSTDD